MSLATSPKHRSTKDAAATSQSPKRGSSVTIRRRSASTSSAADADEATITIPQDGTTGEDLYVHTATDIIQRLVVAYCAAFESSFITRYLLSLLLEALVPGAPTFAKEQAQNQLALMSGAAGQREAVELVKFVQSAGRLTNEALVSNGERELERIGLETLVHYSTSFDAPRAEPVVTAGINVQALEDGKEAQAPATDGDLVSAPNRHSDLRRIAGTRGSVDVRVVPAASIHQQLQQQCSDQQQRLDAQDARIRELEATLSSHRPVFTAVAQHEVLHDKPDAILQRGLKKGVVVKRGKGAVSFIDAAGSTTEGGGPGVAAPSSSASLPTRYDATKEEVIAAARALAADSRRNVVGRTPPPQQQQQQQQQAPLHQYDSASFASPPPPHLSSSTISNVYPSAAIASPYMHALGDIGDRRRDASRHPYQHLAEPPLLLNSAFNGHHHHAPNLTAAGQQQYQYLAAAAGGASPEDRHRRYHMDATPDVLPPTMAHALTTEDVVRIISDKRPLTTQAAQSFSAWYQLEQDQRGRMLLDLGDSSLVAAIQQNSQLASRLSGAAHSLSLERRYTQLHRGPSSTAYVASPAAKGFNSVAASHRPLTSASRLQHAAAVGRGAVVNPDGSSVFSLKY